MPTREEKTDLSSNPFSLQDTKIQIRFAKNQFIDFNGMKNSPEKQKSQNKKSENFDPIYRITQQ